MIDDTRFYYNDGSLYDFDDQGRVAALEVKSDSLYRDDVRMTVVSFAITQVGDAEDFPHEIYLDMPTVLSLSRWLRQLYDTWVDTPRSNEPDEAEQPEEKN